MNCILQGQIKGANKELSNLSNYQKALKNIGGRPNRNLLDNAYFIGGGSQQGNGRFPINQGGKTTYTNSVQAINRWTLLGNNVASITLHPDGVYQEKISSDGYSGFQQAILLGDLEGKALTLSALVDGELCTVTLNAGWTFVDDGTALAVVYFQNASMSLVGDSSDRLIFRFYYGGSVAPADTGMTIQAAKLELGSTQTLAYQDESGVWKLFETPDFATEYIRSVSYNYNGDYIGITLGMGLRVNKNLLDNWYFVGGGSQQGGRQFPINQRGQTSYAGDREKKIDRFISDSVVSLQPDCIRLTNSANMNALWWIQQIFEANRFEVGTTLTVSSLVKVQSTVPFDVRLQATATVNAWGGGAYVPKTGKYELVSYTTTLQAALSGDAGFGLVTHSGADTGNSDYIDVKAMKVEFGTVQTLAYQDEDGNWQLFETPDYGEELAKCQQYQVVIPTLDIIGGTNITTTLYANIPTPVPMRAVPSIENNGVFSVRSNGTVQSNLTANIYGTSFSPQGIRVGIAGEFVINEPYYVGILEPIILNANL